MMYYLAKHNYALKSVSVNILKGTAGYTEIRYLEDFVTIAANNKTEAEKLAEKYFNKKDYTKNANYVKESIIVYETITETHFDDEPE